MRPDRREARRALIEAMLDADISSPTLILSPCNFVNNRATEAAVAYVARAST